MNKREAAKLETRNRVLDAARRLFADPGYDRTTVRAIASLAGCSVGSLFTTFEGKEDILAAIVFERYAGLAEALRSVLSKEAGDPRARMKAAFAAAYAYDFDRHAMLMHQIGATWTWSAETEQKSQAALAAPFGFVFDLLGEAQSGGHIRPDIDLAMLGDMIMGVYLRGWRAGWFMGFDAAGMAAFAAPQIDVVFDGAR
jgi:AcrR family transcriptional regulator